MTGNMNVKGRFRTECFRAGRLIWVDEGPNIVTDEGLNHMLNVTLQAATANATWYCGIFKNNYTPITSSTAAAALGAAGLFGECQDADYGTPATNRPAYTVVASTAKSITNSASKATFTMSASITVYGAFVASSQAKTATTGVLYAGRKFDVARAVISADILYVTYTINASSS